eukprot:m.1143770 g.1143770  ORF g.1143770 m.1143770 type:complete len:71 (-) comp24459_c0_seq19:1837-2049(-)
MQPSPWRGSQARKFLHTIVVHWAPAKRLHCSVCEATALVFMQKLDALRVYTCSRVHRKDAIISDAIVDEA